MFSEKSKIRRRFLFLMVILFILILLLLSSTSNSNSNSNDLTTGDGEDPPKNSHQQLFLQTDNNCGSKTEFLTLKNDILLSPLDPSVINFVQCHHLFPPSNQSQPYQLDIEGGEDPSEISEELGKLFKNWTTPGFFIECGAHDGEFFSNTLALERDKKWTGLLIEAHPLLFAKLGSRHRKAWTCDVCLSPEYKVSELEFMEVNETVRSGRGQNGRNRLKLPDAEINGFTSYGSVPCFPLMTLLTALNVTRVDLFSLDVEGADLKILKTLPFDDRLVIDIILVSNNLTPEGPDAIQEFLEDKDYTVIVKSRDDIIFVRKGMNREDEILKAFK